MLVSFIIPAYNGEKYINQCIKTLQSQRYNNWEAIFINDGSTDNTLIMLMDAANHDNRIKVFSQENKGAAAARNYGIEKANGQYIALLDSDDVWVCNKLECQLQIVQNTKSNIIYCSYDFIDQNGIEIKKPFIVPETTDYNKMLVSSVISCSTALIESGLLKKHIFKSDFYHEDYVLWMELLSIPGVKASGDPKVLAHYRQIVGSRSSGKYNAAKERWKIYRDVLNLSFSESIIAFLKYAVKGALKYYL